jgi:hypothetical protein
MSERRFQIKLRNVLLAMICAGVSFSAWRHNYHLDVVARPFEAISVYALVFGMLGVALGVLFGRLVVAIAVGVATVAACIACEVLWWKL